MVVHETRANIAPEKRKNELIKRERYYDGRAGHCDEGGHCASQPLARWRRAKAAPKAAKKAGDQHDVQIIASNLRRPTPLSQTL
jgi:hypothetical protein